MMRSTLVVTVGVVIGVLAACATPSDRGTAAEGKRGALHVPPGAPLGALPTPTRWQRCVTARLAVFGLQPISGCEARVGDTTYTVYRDTTGQRVALNRKFYVPLARLASVTDSIDGELSAIYGSVVDCPNDPDLRGSFVPTWRIWHYGNVTVQLLSNNQIAPGREFPMVDVEWQARPVGCDQWVGGLRFE